MMGKWMGAGIMMKWECGGMRGRGNGGMRAHEIEGMGIWE